MAGSETQRWIAIRPASQAVNKYSRRQERAGQWGNSVEVQAFSGSGSDHG